MCASLVLFRCFALLAVTSWQFVLSEQVHVRDYGAIPNDDRDDTAAAFWRGHATFTASYLGRGADPEEARRQAIGAARGLHVIGAAPA